MGNGSDIRRYVVTSAWSFSLPTPLSGYLLVARTGAEVDLARRLVSVLTREEILDRVSGFDLPETTRRR